MWAQLKKFGLDHDDFPSIVENVGLLLWVLTINIQKKWTGRVHLIFYITTPIAFFTYLYVYLFSAVYLVFFRYGNKDIAATSVIVAIGLNSIISAVKFLFMKLYSNEIKDTVDDFLKCNSQVAPDSRFAKNLRKHLRVTKKRASLIWITFAINGLIYLILPLATPGRHFTIELFILFGLDPMFESPNYEIATVIFTISSGFAVYSMVGIAVYVLVIVGYNEALMYTLSEELRYIWNDSQTFYNVNKHKIIDKRQAIYVKEQIMNEFIRIRLKDIIWFHITNINLLRDLKRELRPLLALEYTLLVIAIISELLGGLEHTYLALPYTIVQMLMDCLAGQRLIDASDEFERSVYSCQWENFNVSNQKTVFLMLIMSKKTLILSAGGFATLNYQFLMAILRTSYSTYTTLRSTVN